VFRPRLACRLALTMRAGRVILLSWHFQGRRQPPSRWTRRTIGCSRVQPASVGFRDRNSSASTLPSCSNSTAGILSREAPESYARWQSAAKSASCSVPAGSAAALICDTSALLDYLVAGAPDHRLFRNAIDQARTRYIPALVLAEVDYFLRDERRAMQAFMQDVARGAFIYAPPSLDQLSRAMEIDRRYGDLGLGLVDGSWRLPRLSASVAWRRVMCATLRLFGCMTAARSIWSFIPRILMDPDRRRQTAVRAVLHVAVHVHGRSTTGRLRVCLRAWPDSWKPISPGCELPGVSNDPPIPGQDDQRPGGSLGSGNVRRTQETIGRSARSETRRE
jgi:PIN domain